MKAPQVPENLKLFDDEVSDFCYEAIVNAKISKIGTDIIIY